MEYKKAIEVLQKMLETGRLLPEEKEAVITALGALDWGVQGENRFKNFLKRKKEEQDRTH